LSGYKATLARHSLATQLFHTSLVLPPSAVVILIIAGNGEDSQVSFGPLPAI